MVHISLDWPQFQLCDSSPSIHWVQCYKFIFISIITFHKCETFFQENITKNRLHRNVNFSWTKFFSDNRIVRLIKPTLNTNKMHIDQSRRKKKKYKWMKMRKLWKVERFSPFNHHLISRLLYQIYLRKHKKIMP